MALLPWRTGKLIRTKDHNETTRSFWLEVADTDVFDFIPGQFVTFDLPIHEKANKRLRSYSIASWPDGSNIFELVIVLTPDGTGTNYLFHEVKVGDTLKFRGALGVFTLPQTAGKDIFMICTGTGVAPFRSMVQYIKQEKLEAGNITLVFGSRKKENLLYYDEFRELEISLKGFRYIPVLSRENWEGQTGYVHGVYEELAAETPAAEFYLCGWKNMIDDARQRIRMMGFPDKAVHLELYG
jgi:ferredoxin-NADP reductase